ncbi:MAG: hypothetical protein ACKO9H_09950, partial [Planctomycetota bacterium]
QGGEGEKEFFCSVSPSFFCDGWQPFETALFVGLLGRLFAVEFRMQRGVRFATRYSLCGELAFAG